MQPAVHVIATTLEGTRAALEAAVPLADGSKAGLVVFVPRIASFPAEADSTDATAAFVKIYEEIVCHLGAKAEIEVCSCRSLDDLAARVCNAAMLIVVGGPAGRWLTSPEERFANRLADAGCRVLFATTGTNNTQRRKAFPPAAAL